MSSRPFTPRPWGRVRNFRPGDSAGTHRISDFRRGDRGVVFFWRPNCGEGSADRLRRCSPRPTPFWSWRPEPRGPKRKPRCCAGLPCCCLTVPSLATPSNWDLRRSRVRTGPGLPSAGFSFPGRHGAILRPALRVRVWKGAIAWALVAGAFWCSLRISSGAFPTRRTLPRFRPATWNESRSLFATEFLAKRGAG